MADNKIQSRNVIGFVTVLVLFLALTGTARLLEASENQTGEFWRLYWYEDGVEHGNPKFNSRFRVNDPASVLHPTYGKRIETRANGMMQILMEEDLSLLSSAELYLEIWGGHPGTANKRVTVNGRGTYSIPDTGTEKGHCAHVYPTLQLSITDLVNGYNALQFACDKGSSFWGHFIVENACLRAGLKPNHPSLEEQGFSDFQASINIEPSPENEETFALSLECSQSPHPEIQRVDYIGYYNGYDENGNGATCDWHGMTKKRAPLAILGTVKESPYRLEWDTRMLPSQTGIKVKAIVYFKNNEQIIYEAPPITDLQIPERNNEDVALYPCENFPTPFWSRANRLKTAEIHLDCAPSAIKHAQLHTVVWDGGRGGVTDYFKLNGHPLPVAGEGRHDVLYTIIDIDPTLLMEGSNQIELLSNTDHHGIEILLPGPALMIRRAKQSAAIKN